MKLNELIGYRENPIYQKAKALYDPEAISKAGSHSSRTNRINQAQEFQKFLAGHGFVKLDSGSFGYVYEKRGYPWIFKIFTQDPAYLDFLKYALANQSNPNLPKIKGKILRINNDTYAVRMEKLTSFRQGKHQSKDLIDLADILDRMQWGSESGTDKEWLTATFPGIAHIFKDLHGSRWPFDLHDGNMMMRGNVPVVIDPIYDPRGMNEDQGQEFTWKKSNPIFQKGKELFAPKKLKKASKTYGDPREAQFEKFSNFLSEHGFYMLGQGVFGAVFEKPGYPWVFKVFHRDPAYFSYLKWVMQHQDNTAVPKIKGRILKINKDTYAIRMEKLQPFRKRKIEQIGMLFDKIEGIHKFSNLTGANKTWVKKNFPDIFEVLQAMGSGTAHFDLHSGNFMMRGNQVVISDPLVDENYFEEGKLR